MGTFSEEPKAVREKNEAEGYVGLHIYQGVPVLDRDLNLIQDLLFERFRGFLARYVGDGISPDTPYGFMISENNGESLTNFRINPGSCLVNGFEIHNGDEWDYQEYCEERELTAPKDPLNNEKQRIDTVYLDVWLTTEQTDVDESYADLGFSTSARRKLNWRVRVAEDMEPARLKQSKEQETSNEEKESEEHWYFLLARLRHKEKIIDDLRVVIPPLNAGVVNQPTFAEQPLKPTSGPVGTEIALYGTNFISVYAVGFVRHDKNEPQITVFREDFIGQTLDCIKLFVPEGLTSSRDYKIKITGHFGDIDTFQIEKLFTVTE